MTGSQTSSPTADSSLAAPSPAFPPSIPPPDTAVPAEESSLLVSNPFGSSNREYISTEISLRPWWRVRYHRWSQHDFSLMASIVHLETFLAFCREITIALEHNRLIRIEHLPCSDNEFWFTLWIGWRSEEEQLAVEQALSNAFWHMPI